MKSDEELIWEAYINKSILDSEDFKRWFEGSKIVNEDGSPKVMYHGTSSDVDFKKFRKKQSGIWFTDDPKSASEYALDNDSQKSVFSPTRGNPWAIKHVNTKSRVIPVVLNVKNPFYGRDEAWDRAENYNKAAREFIFKLKQKGYDGWVMGTPESPSVVNCFDPSQVRSIYSMK